MSSKKPPDRFAFGKPEVQEAEPQMPVTLDIVEYQPARGRAKKKMAGGAYNPYESSGAVGDTARVQKPRVDLRKLSEWIKTTQQVQTLREEENLAPDAKPPRGK